MAEETSTEGTDDEGGSATEQQDSSGQSTELGDAGKKALAEERRQRKAAERELAQLRAASMSEQEKAVAAAKAEGTLEAAKAAAPRLVRAEFRAAAAGQVDKQTLDAYLEDVNLSKFIGEDGEPDLKAIEARIKRLGGGKNTNFDGGARTSAAKPHDMNSLIRQAAGMG